MWIEIPDEALTSGVRPVQHEKLNVIVYPNPTSDDNVNIKVTVLESDPLLVMILDSTGKTILEQEVSAYDMSLGLRLAPSEKMSTGIYVLHVTQGNHSGQFKIAIRN